MAANILPGVTSMNKKTFTTDHLISTIDAGARSVLMITEKIRYVIIACAVLLVGACSTTTPDKQQDLSYLAKTDIDTVVDIHRQRSNALLAQLVGKLYKRNPRFCKVKGLSLAVCIKRARTIKQADWQAILGDCSGSGCIKLAFTDEFAGDRVLALAVGLRSMLDAAYDHKQEFFLTDELDPQKLYNSARNIEITVWRLAHRRDSHGQPYLLTDSLDEGVRNLSYERLFGKLISLQDTLAMIIAERDNRLIKNVIQRLATAVFLPI
jgi:hypothetical protein